MNLKIFINLIAHSMTLYNDLNNPSISFIIMNTILENIIVNIRHKIYQNFQYITCNFGSCSQI